MYRRLHQLRIASPVTCLLAAVGTLVVCLAATSALAAGARKVTVTMKEFSFQPAKIQLKVGEVVDLTLRNAGQVSHDWMAGSDIVNSQEEKGFRKDLVALLKPTEAGRKFAAERPGAPSKPDSIKRISRGFEIEPGGEVTLRFTVPATAKGDWQMACVLTGHYESGMKGTVEIR